MLRRTQDNRPEKANDNGLDAISETLKSRPVYCDFLIQKSGTMRGNCIMRVARNLLESNGGYCRGDDRRA